VSTTATNLGAGGVALLILALICWVIQLIFLFSVIGRDVHGDAVVGQAYGWIAACLFGGLSWLWLGGLLLKAGSQGAMPGWVSLPAVILYLGSGAAGVVAFYLMQDPKRVWPMIIPVLIPPIVAFYAFALFCAPLRGFFAGLVGSATVLGVILILVIAPWPAFFRALDNSRANRAEHAKAQKEWEVQERARKRAENLPKIQAMTEANRLMDWYPLLDPENGVRDEAFEALRHTERRQSDIEDMLGWGVPMAMYLLPDLDLKGTPKLCEVAKAYLLKSAKESRIRPKQDPAKYPAGDIFEKSVPAIRWLMARGCDCDEGIAALEATVLSYLDSPDRQTALATLAELRTKK
jgi:hypothetical protein